MKIINKKYLLIYLLLSIGLITLGYLFSDAPAETIDVYTIGYKDLFIIFIYNSIFMLILLLLSFTGIPIIYITVFLYSMGESGKVSGIDPTFYYTASFPHGLLEIILGGIVVFYSVRHIVILFNFFMNKTDLIQLKIFYKNTITKLIPIYIGILALAALTEVYISNPLIRYMTSLGG